MPDLINKLSSYAALIGVIGAIGGGFYAWGEFNTRLSAIEEQEFVVNQTVDLTNTHDRIVKGDKESMEAIRSLAAALESLRGDIAINAKAIEFNGIIIEEAIARSENPLAN